jgi:Zn-dependent protease with chaperone function
MDVLVGMAYGLAQWVSLPLDTPITKGLDTKSAPGSALWLMLRRTWDLLVPAWLVWATSAAVLAGIAGATLRKIAAISQGGPAIARMLDARPIVRVRAQPLERRFLNLVEEMAIAAGLPVPRAYVLDRAAGINALTAGFTPRDAVILVTRGALATLERDELQGVVAHEMSHVLNGDVRLNTWMIGLLAGLVSVGALGGFLLSGSDPDADGPEQTRMLMARAALGMPFAMLGGIALFLLGSVLAVLGGASLVFARLIKATVSREREFLADASAVQFTRNPEALAGALARIERHRFGSRLHHRQAEALSHMFFAASVLIRIERLFATHPPIAGRIARIAPRLHAERYLEDHPAKSEEERIADAMREARDPAPQEGTLAFDAARSGEAVVDSVGNPSREHARYAASLLESLPLVLRDTLATPDGAKAVLLALALAPDGGARQAQIASLQEDDPVLAGIANETARQLPRLDSAYRLPLVTLAMPVLAQLGAEGKRAFLDQLRRVIDADGRLTPREFVLYVLLRQVLVVPVRAKRPRYRSLAEVSEDATLILALLACASGHAAAGGPFRQALAVACLPGTPLPDVQALLLDRVVAALERLDAIPPLAKPALLKACVAAVRGPAGIRMQEAELLRAVAAAVDCPLPPFAIAQ